jgi:hypothetical protein
MVGVPSCGHTSRSVNLLHSGQIRLPPRLFDDELELGVFIYLPRLINDFTPPISASQSALSKSLSAILGANLLLPRRRNGRNFLEPC